ncbi:uncharacterized protein Z518_07797 [Rhinocladiella mackenziei CBS 650.93]|uniref:Apoptosis regulator Bcl-2 family BH4 domain-containing protein n=1 Tax=Rhinocladiella mackenziei CBS 650.93 TaxID=1442369 RepID=A0A0D2H1B2_9EURO|nr:uncharacterized protein Z518_07797 [Rhinocladiella mackenziei CBS 650.93]KIX04243.1 hypothetical protein Z518_07797 [Rhinocladiella mackenziei CBS 650.93]
MPSQPVKDINLPKFDELPLDLSHPPHSAWYLWGKNDQLGCLNLLTPERVVQAATNEIKTGISVGLNWGMDQMRVPPFYRTKLEHEIFGIGEFINDDKLEFNTQNSSQWDSFRHWSFPDGRFYNGVTQDEVRDGISLRNGIHEWAKRGIVGRGVLIDFYSYMLERHGKDWDPWMYHKVPVSVIEAIAKDKEIIFQTGDILFIRTGFVKRYQTMPLDELTEKMDQPEYHYPGLEGSKESLRWLWDSHFAAVAADSPGFEAWSAGLNDSDEQFRMHEIVLSGFGLPIGELFDLEALATECERQHRWSFFVTSMPLNVPGGVGSPPNAVAIF